MNTKNIFVGLIVALLAVSFASATVDTTSRDKFDKGFDLSSVQCTLPKEHNKDFNSFLTSLTPSCDNEKKTCEDYNAVCVPKEKEHNLFSLNNNNNRDKDKKGVCACAEGFTFDQKEKMCVKNEVPEFGVIAGGIALIGAIAGIAIIRKRN